MRHTLFPAPGFIQIAFCGGGGGAPAPTPPPPREETDTPSAYDPDAALKRYDVGGTGWATGVKDLFKTPEAIPEDLSGWKVTGGRRNYSLEFKDGTSIPLTLSKYDDEQSRIQQLVDNLGAARGDYQAYSTYQAGVLADQGAAAAAEAKRIADAQAAAEAKRIADEQATAEAKRVADAQAAADQAAAAAEAKRIADQQAAVAATRAKLNAAETAYSGLQDTYTTTMEEMTKLQSDFDNLFSDYSALGTDKSSLQGAYDDMMGQYTSLEGTLATTRDQMAEKNRLYNETASSLSGLQEDFTGLQGDYSGLQSSFDNLQTDYGLTSEQLAKSLEDAGNLRQERQVMQTQNFLQGAEADKARRMEAGAGGIGSFVPAQTEYTQAQDAMSQTALNPMSYNMAPIDFTGGMDNNIFNPTPFSAPGADAASGYTDIFSGPSMGLTQYGYDYGANFNPYFDALNEQYGIPMTGVKR